MPTRTPRLRAARASSRASRQLKWTMYVSAPVNSAKVIRWCTPSASTRGGRLSQRWPSPGLPAAQVDDVRLGPRQFSEGHQVVHSLGLDAGRTAFVVLARTGPACGEKLPLAFGDQGFVFAMGRDDDAQLPGELERAIKRRVPGSKKALRS